MVVAQRLGEYLEHQVGVKSLPRDLDEERKLVESIGLGLLSDLDQELSNTINSSGMNVRVLEDLSITGLPKGFNDIKLKRAIIEYFAERGYTNPKNFGGSLIYSIQDSSSMSVVTTHMPDNTYLITVQENRLGLAIDRN